MQKLTSSTLQHPDLESPLLINRQGRSWQTRPV